MTCERCRDLDTLAKSQGVYLDAAEKYVATLESERDALRQRVALLEKALLEARWFVDNFPSDSLPGDKDFCTPIDLVNTALDAAGPATPEGGK